MELDATRQTLMCCGTSEEKNAVLPLECSIILPDYYPDVMKVLSYGAETSLLPVTADSSGETVSGDIRVNASYLSDEGKLCCVNRVQPFSHVFAGDGEISAAAAQAETGDISCRAVSKRRIDIHGSINICLREMKLCPEETAQELAGEETVCLCRESENTVIMGEFYKSFTVEERAELGYGKPPFGKVLLSRAFANISECRVAEGKIAVKGELRLHILWESEETEDSPQQMISSEYAFPVSRLIEAPGVTETDTCEAFLTADFPEISPESEGGALSVKVKVGAFARVYRKSGISYIADAFSCEGESEPERKLLCIAEGAFPASQSIELTESFELPEDAEGVIDMWAELPSQPRLGENGNVCFKVKFCALLRSFEGGASYYEKIAEKETTCPSGSRKTAFYDLRFSVLKEDFSQNRGGSAEISAAVFIDGTVYTCREISAVTGCLVSTEGEKPCSDAALVFCFAEKGEQIWDLAKHYRTRPERICAENAAEGEALSEDAVLIIPR